jgi:hypothetical protein
MAAFLKGLVYAEIEILSMGTALVKRGDDSPAVKVVKL